MSYTCPLKLHMATRPALWLNGMQSTLPRNLEAREGAAELADEVTRETEKEASTREGWKAHKRVANSPSASENASFEAYTARHVMAHRACHAVGTPCLAGKAPSTLAAHSLAHVRMAGVSLRMLLRVRCDVPARFCGRHPRCEYGCAPRPGPRLSHSRSLPSSQPRGLVEAHRLMRSASVCAAGVVRRTAALGGAGDCRGMRGVQRCL